MVQFRREVIAAALSALAFAGEAVAQTVVAKVGFMNSEAARYDDRADDYLVSNIGERGPGNNGFIARVAPDGKLKTLKWIAGSERGAELYDPLGIYVKGDLLYAADPKAIRVFDRKTGAYRRSIDIPAAERLNDLVVAEDGTIYVTDSRLPTVTEPGAVYRVSPAGQVTVFAGAAAEVGNPNGVALAADGTIVHGGRGAELMWRNPATGAIVRRQTLPTGRIDGIVLLADGALLVASQEGRNVYRVPPDGAAPTVVADGFSVPAAIGFDHRRGRLLVPQIVLSSLTIVDLK